MTFKSTRLLLISSLLLALAGCDSSSPNMNPDDAPAPPQSANDADGDGVLDGADNCANTPTSETADSNGCSPSQLDTDNDGVSNADDACPGTPDGTAVDATGCPDASADTDMDGVSDAADVCPDSVIGNDSAGNPFVFNNQGCPILVGDRDGISYDVFLSSDVDGERVAFTVHEPRSLSATPGQYPIVGNAHGYSGRRISARPAQGANSLLGRLLDKDYGAFSMDQRGHGDSGGQIRLLDPEVEGQDMLQIVDWIGTHVNWREPDSTGYVLGAYGSSYGGGFQHTIQKLDPDNRFDAIAPDITWNDLRYSINTNNVFKSKWGAFLSTVAQSTPGGHHQQVNDGLAEGLSTGDLSQTEMDLLYFTSYRYNCDGTNTGNFITRASTGAPMDAGLAARPVPTLYTQGTSDTLFDLTEAYNNYTCQRLAGSPDVRLYTQPFGHDDLVGAGQCGSINTNDLKIAFFDAHLKGDNTDLSTYPDICIHLGGTHAIQRTHAQGFPYGNNGDSNNTFTADYRDPTGTLLLNFAFQEAANSMANVPVYTALADDEILAGIPTIQLNITRDPASANSPTDAILFVAIAVSRDGGVTYEQLNTTASAPTGQVTPFRDSRISPTDVLELAGIETVLGQGDIVAVRYVSSDPTYLNSGTKVPLSGTIEATVNLPLLGVRGVSPEAPALP